MSGAERTFAYSAVRPDGRTVADVIRAADRGQALRRLAQSQVTVTAIREAGAPGASWSRDRITEQERVLVLRQLAVMTRAGVELLEALDTIAGAFGRRAVAQGLRATAAALRRGEPIAKALAEGLPGYPAHVYALVRAGEAGGRLDRVLAEAADQLAFERRIRREVRLALAYPTFLLCAGTAAVVFLFYVVVPRFADMLGPKRDQVAGLPDLVLGAGEAFRADGPLWLAGLAAAVAALAAGASSPQGRAAVSAALGALPVAGRLVAARQRAGWARIMAFAVSAGVGLLESAELALASAPEGPFRRALVAAFRSLRAGEPVAEAFGRAGALAAVDVSLLRAGQRSGALAEMFQLVAEIHEEALRDALKRTTLIVEQAAVALIAGAIGAVVVSLVTAMTSVYDSIG